MATELNILDDLVYSYGSVAEQFVDWRVMRNKTAPPKNALTNSILSIRYEDTIEGSSTLTIELLDPEFQFCTTFLDVNRNGKMDPVDVKFPPGDPNAWWRMTQVSIHSAGGGAARVEMTFMERPIIYLLAHTTPIKRSRARGSAGMTRAQFLKLVTSKVKAHGGLRFVSRQLKREQYVAGSRPVSTGGGGGTKLLWVGDSLGSGSYPEAKKIEPKTKMEGDNKVSRTSTAAIAVLEEMVDTDTKRVVFDHGVNDGTVAAFKSSLSAAYAITGNRDLVIPTQHRASKAASEPFNEALEEFVAAHTYAYLADWNALATDHPEWMAKDKVHATPTGYQKRAALILEAFPSRMLRAPIHPESSLAMNPVDLEPEPEDEPTNNQKPKTDTDKRKESKSSGIREDSGVTIKGIKANPDQIKEVNAAMDTAIEVNAPELAVMAMLVAGIGESAFLPVMNYEGSGYGGVFQGDVSNGTNNYVWRDDYKNTGLMAESFFKGGKGFHPAPSGGTAGGAIHTARVHKDWTPGKIATETERSGKPASFYDDMVPGSKPAYDATKESKALYDAYGGGADHGTTTTRAQYAFSISSAEDKETYWDGMNRLAREVRWRVFVQGRTVYFDPDTELIRQVPAAYITRRDPAVLAWDATWDSRNIASEVRMDLVCNPFDFRAGEVFVLRNFGPLSLGSTVDLPGRWLILSSERTSGSVFSTFTLGQPVKPGPEPAGKTITRNEDDSDDPSDVGTGRGDALKEIEDDWTAANIINRLVLDIANKQSKDLTAATGGALNVENVRQSNLDHRHLGSRSDHHGVHEGGQTRYAVDINYKTVQTPTDNLDRVAKALINAFGMPDLGNWNATSGAAAGNLVTDTTHKKWRYQIIWRYDDPTAGNHYNHVHFGVKLK